MPTFAWSCVQDVLLQPFTMRALLGLIWNRTYTAGKKPGNTAYRQTQPAMRDAEMLHDAQKRFSVTSVCQHADTDARARHVDTSQL